MTEQEIEDKIHAMSIKELKQWFENATPIEIKINPNELPPEEPILEEELLLQSMSVAELNALYEKSTPINLAEVAPKTAPPKLKEKVAKTGLSKKVIKKIETNKYKATLEEIIAYCKGLKINFKDFLPELFGQSA